MSTPTTEALAEALRLAREGYASEEITGLPVTPQWRERTLARIDAALAALAQAEAKPADLQARITQLETECANWQRWCHEAEAVAQAEAEAKPASADLCERICAAIKAADDKSLDEAGYMLDSYDCIAIVREQFAAAPAAPASEPERVTDAMVERLEKVGELLERVQQRQAERLAAPAAPAPDVPVAVPQGPNTEFVLNELRSALNAMLTFFGMDEDDSNKEVFDKARQAYDYAQIVMRPLEPWERQSLEDFRACVSRWHAQAVAKGFDGVEAMCETALPYGTRDLRLVAAPAAPAAAPTPAWQPIETAPKDEEVLLFGQINKRAFIGAWGDYMRINQPRITHWMPLPAPPAIATSKGGGKPCE